MGSHTYIVRVGKPNGNDGSGVWRDEVVKLLASGFGEVSVHDFYEGSRKVDGVGWRSALARLQEELGLNP